jgi:4-alpha-glucanotransferase
VEEVVAATYGLLAEAPCRILTVALDDLAAVAERPNMPGTIDAWPNWSIALPEPIEDLEASPLAAVVARHMTSPPAPALVDPASGAGEPE